MPASQLDATGWVTITVRRAAGALDGERVVVVVVA